MRSSLSLATGLGSCLSILAKRDLLIEDLVIRFGRRGAFSRLWQWERQSVKSGSTVYFADFEVHA